MSRFTYYVHKLDNGRWEVRDDLGIGIDYDSRKEAMEAALKSARFCRLWNSGRYGRVIAEVE